MIVNRSMTHWLVTIYIACGICKNFCAGGVAEALENSYKCCVVCYPNLLYAIDGLGEASETGNICILF